MSTSLDLLPLRGLKKLDQRFVLCYDRLNFVGDYRIFGQLTNMSDRGRDDIPTKPTIKTRSIPRQMWVQIYEDEGVKRTRNDMYGNELTFVYAKQLKKLVLPADASKWNKAIMAFVAALPNDTPIILLWR
jgi:hypothetical protein